MRLLSVQDALLFRFRLIIPAFFPNFVKTLQVTHDMEKQEILQIAREKAESWLNEAYDADTRLAVKKLLKKLEKNILILIILNFQQEKE